MDSKRLEKIFFLFCSDVPFYIYMTYTTDLIGTGNTHVCTCINVKITTHFTAHPFISEIHMYDITCWIFIHIL